MKQFLLLLTFLAASLFLQSQQCNVIYVSPTGASSGAAGTRTNPASLTYGLTLVSGSSNHVWMAQGTYNISAPIQLVNNLILEGGFDATTWVKSNATPTIIHRDNSNVLPSPANALVAIGGLNNTGFRLQDLTINVDAAPGTANSVYGIYLAGCSNYGVVRCNVTTGAGAPGVAGVVGANGQNGGNGAAGLPGNGNEIIQPGGAGGVGIGGGNGGDGQHSGLHSGQTNPGPGQTGGGGCGGVGGATGTGPQCSAGCFFGSPSCGSVTSGQNGQPGGSGTAGGNGAAGAAGTVAAGYFVPGLAAGTGTAGGIGCGGGGGGGGGGRQNSGTDDVGGSGGGGGGGGEGGFGGTGGTGGGGSFAVFLFTNGAGGSFVDCSLNPGAGGAGGLGGAGGAGGTGGLGGAGGGPGPCGNSFGGSGGNGGNGANGGNGGNGATGSSAALFESAGVPVTQSNITSVPGNPPVISVLNYGCTNAEVLFTATTSGAWNFGAGASPATANSSGPISVTYSSVGRKDISFSGTVFTGFVEIFSNNALSNSITHTNNPAVVGCPDTFSTSIPGSLYEWYFGADALPQADTNVTPTATTAFTTQGAHTVYVWVTTTCCGRVLDSLVFNVGPNSLNVSLTASDDTICAGNNITYTASPAGYLQYTFLIDNNPVQSSAANTFSSTTLQTGDTVMVIAFDGVCYTNPSALLMPMVISPPNVTLSSSDADNIICEGDLVTFTATPSGFSTYQFFDNGTSVQNNSSNIFNSTTLQPGNSITVVATDNGCPGPASNAIVTTVNLLPNVTLAAQPNPSCTGDNVTLTATPAGFAGYDFTINGSSVQNTASNTHSSTTFASGDVAVVQATNNGCTGAASSSVVITVNPIPSVTLSSSDADNQICGGESVTFTASPAGYGLYEFFDNGGLVQSGVSEIYTTTTLINGSSITVVATNLGCVSPASNSITITVTPPPVVSAGNDQQACVNEPAITLSGFSPAGGSWSGTGITNPTGTFDPATAGAGSFTLTYNYTDPGTGCSAADDLQFTVFALPQINMQHSYDICEGESAQLSAAGGVGYQWSPSAGLNFSNIPNPLATPVATTTYTVVVTDANNCSAADSAVVNVHLKPVADFTVNDVCEGLQSVFFNASSPLINTMTFVYDFGDGQGTTLPSPGHVYPAAGTYNVQLIVTLGICSDTVLHSTVVHPAAVADFDAAPTIQYDNTGTQTVFTNNSQNALNYDWSFGDGTTSADVNPVHTYNEPGVYTVSLVAFNQYGCADTLIKPNYITVYPGNDVFIPNVFSPNGDGVNDEWQVITFSTKFFSVQIFNRWGEMIYESNNLNEKWNGLYKGELLQQGVYVYLLDMVHEDNTEVHKKGSVTLVR